MKVLIIEDDNDISSLMKEELELYRIKTRIARSGVEAYKILYRTLPKFQFDYIITDIGLPDENGVEIIKCVKQKFTTKIIIYTGKDYEDYKDKCEYDYYLEKGVKTIFDVVDVILNENLR
jgi:two-component system, OmpR family, KDP operon response regulator KdpE